MKIWRRMISFIRKKKQQKPSGSIRRSYYSKSNSFRKQSGSVRWKKPSGSVRQSY